MNKYVARIQYGLHRTYHSTHTLSLADAIQHFKNSLIPGEILIQVQCFDTNEDSGKLNYRKPNPPHVLEL